MVRGYVTELDDFRARIQDFVTDDPADILSAISAISGRLAEMRARLFRGTTQRCTVLRTREVDPLREELEFQFKVWSRKIALLEWELKMSGGGV